MTGARSRERWNRSSRASTRASSSRRVERPGHDVVRAGLEEADPLLDVVAGADAHDRDRRHRRRRPDLAADLDRASSAPVDDVEDDELVFGGLGERLVRVGRQGDGVAGAGQDRRDRLAGRRDRFRGAGWCWRARSLRGWRRWRSGRVGIGQEDTTATPARPRASRDRRAVAAVVLDSASVLSAPCRIDRQRGIPIGRSVARMRRYELMLVIRPDVRGRQEPGPRRSDHPRDRRPPAARS